MDTLQSWHFSGWPFLYGCHVLAAAFYSLLMLMTTKMVRWYICLYLEPSKSAHKYNHFHNLMVTLVVQIAVPCADSECEQLEIYTPQFIVTCNWIWHAYFIVFPLHIHLPTQMIMDLSVGTGLVVRHSTVCCSLKG